MNIPQTSESNNKLYIQKNYPEFYNYIIKYYKDYPHNKFSELLYCYYNNIDVHPICPVCGSYVPFLSYNRGYQKYCCGKCAANSKETKSKRINTNIEKFGVPHAAQNNTIKEKLISTYIENNGGMGNASITVKEKQQSTMLNKYGTEHALQNKSLKEKSISTWKEHYNGIGAGSDIIKEKIINTNQSKYNSNSPLGNIDIQEKSKQTSLQKYGTEYPIQNESIKQKSIDAKKQSFLAKYSSIIDSFEENDILYYKVVCPHKTCSKCDCKSYIIPAHTYWDRQMDSTEPCTNLLPIGEDRTKNTSIEIFVKNILDKYNIEYETNNRTILNGKELDIYIPSKKIAIECNGVYWHSSRIKSPKYHMDKFIECQKQNIQLLTIWQDWIIYKKDIVESVILSKLGIYKNRIGARNCYIEEILTKDCNKFLNENHIQGSGKASVHIGLYYNKELVSVMTFGKKISCSGDNKKNSTEWNLNRFCTLKGMQIIGGAEKLLKYFIKKYNPITIVSFSSNDISNGALYKKLGFNSTGSINSCYWYIDKKTNIRYHRSNFTKSALQQKGWVINQTEVRTMYDHGYLQCYDAGQQKWILKKEPC